MNTWITVLNPDSLNIDMIKFDHPRDVVEWLTINPDHMLDAMSDNVIEEITGGTVIHKYEGSKA